jgi:hypothetical protein
MISYWSGLITQYNSRLLRVRFVFWIVFARVCEVKLVKNNAVSASYPGSRKRLLLFSKRLAVGHIASHATIFRAQSSE